MEPGTLAINGLTAAPGPALISLTVKVDVKPNVQKESRCLECLSRIRLKDSEALAQLYDDTSSMLYGLAVRILNDPADAEEVVLDVYQYVWKSAQTFDEGRGTVWSWLVILARSRAIDRLRRADARRSHEVPVGIGSQGLSGFATPDVAALFQEERDMVRSALERLSSTEREAIELAYFKGMTHVEISEALAEPLGTIKTRIRAGLRKLRETLAPMAAGGRAL